MRTESEAEEVLAGLLERDGWLVSRQVHLGAKRVDIVATTDRQLWAIEVKLRDWRRAMGQAFVNAAYVDNSYIALPANERRRLDGETLRQLGIGLIEFTDKEWLIRLPPRTSSHSTGTRLRV